MRGEGGAAAPTAAWDGSLHHGARGDRAVPPPSMREAMADGQWPSLRRGRGIDPLSHGEPLQSASLTALPEGEPGAFSDSALHSEFRTPNSLDKRVYTVHTVHTQYT